MLKKLDDLLFKGVHLSLLGFLLYGGLRYAPDSSVTAILLFLALFAVVWFICSIIFKINDFRVEREIYRRYH